MSQSRHLGWMLLLAMSGLFQQALVQQTCAQSYSLVDGRRAGEPSQVKATLQVVGKLTSPAANLEDAPMAASCQVSFQDIVGSTSGGESRSTRCYQTAAAELSVGTHKETTSLPATIATVIASLQDSETIEFVSPDGSLSRGELDAITLPGDALAVYRLLPSQPVTEGQQWTHSADDLAALLNLEHVGVNETKSELVKVENGLAQMRITGVVKGRASGVATDMRITGDYRYDLKWKHINWLQLRIKERRDQSPVAPGFNVDAEVRMLISPLPQAQLVAQLKSAPGEVSTRDRLLRYESESAGYELLHGRRWYLVDERSRYAAWRVVEDDDVIAQCNAIRLKDLAAGKQLSIEEFQTDIKKALGQQFGQFEAANQKARNDGGQILRVAVRGLASGIPVRWVYYHVSNGQGQRANLVFVMDVENTEKLGNDDVIAATTMAIHTSSAALPDVPEDEKGQQPPAKPTAETASRAAGNQR